MAEWFWAQHLVKDLGLRRGAWGLGLGLQEYQTAQLLSINHQHDVRGETMVTSKKDDEQEPLALQLHEETRIFIILCRK